MNSRTPIRGQSGGAAYEFRGKVANWPAHLAGALAAHGPDVRVTAGGITVRPARPGLEG